MAQNDWKRYFDSLKAEDWGTAREVLEKISGERSDDPNVYLKLGDTCQRAGDTVQAISSYHQSVRLFTLQGFIQKALAVCKIILRLDPHDPAATAKSRDLMMELESMKAIPPPAESASPFPEETEGRAIPAAGAEEPGFCVAEEEPTFAGAFPLPGTSCLPKMPGLFAGMSEEEYAGILDELQPRSFRQGEEVVSEGDSGDSMYIIKSGRARVVAHLLGREVELAALTEGDVFGEVAFLTGRPRTASVIASGELSVFEIGRVAIERILEENPSVLSKLEEFYKGRVADTIRKVMPGKNRP